MSRGQAEKREREEFLVLNTEVVRRWRDPNCWSDPLCKMGVASSSTGGDRPPPPRGVALAGAPREKGAVLEAFEGPTTSFVKLPGVSIGPDGETTKIAKKAASPIHVSHLEAGTPHVGGVLRARVIAQGKIGGGGVSCVVEDCFGAVVKVGVSQGGASVGMSGPQLFPVGRIIAVYAPVLKLGTDGLYFVHVDRLEDIATTSLPDDDPSLWRQEGNSFLSRSDPWTAVDCFTRGINLLAPTAAVLSSNRAAAGLKLAANVDTICDAAVAVHLDPDNMKALYRLASALHANDHDGPALDLARLGIRRCSSTTVQPFRKLAGDIEEALGSVLARSSSTLWWEDVVIDALRSRRRPDNDDDEHRSWLDFKDDGNAHFRSNDCAAAIASYSQALRVWPGLDELAMLLGNRAAAAIAKGDPASLEIALRDATVAVALIPERPKLWFRRAQALEGLQWTKAALKSCLIARLQLGAADDRAIANLEERLRRPASLPCRERPSTAKQREERNLMDPEAGIKYSPVEHQALLNAMFDDMSLDGKAKIKEWLGYDLPSPLPKFHEEFERHAAWPPGVDVEAARRLLWIAYETSRGLPFQSEMAMIEQGFSPSKAEVLKRLSGNIRVDWYANPARRFGDVCPPVLDLMGFMPPYDPKISHGFSNQAYRREKLVKGTVHVAAGFVDLGILLAADLDASSSHHRGPLRFVGFERSAYAVAKTLVIWEMIALIERPTPASALTRAVLQVWFSTTWTLQTSTIFKAAVRGALHRYQGRSTDDVRAILGHWAASPGVTLQTARSRWLDDGQKKAGPPKSLKIAQFSQRQDRLAAAAYKLTGSFGVDSSIAAPGLVGSVVFFDTPDGTPPLSDVETVLGTIALQTQLETAYNLNSTLIHAVEVLHVENIQKLIRRGRSGDVVVELHHKPVEEAVELIAAMHPWTMSWEQCLNQSHRTVSTCRIRFRHRLE